KGRQGRVRSVSSRCLRRTWMFVTGSTPDIPSWNLTDRRLDRRPEQALGVRGAECLGAAHRLVAPAGHDERLDGQDLALHGEATSRVLALMSGERRQAACPFPTSERRARLVQQAALRREIDVAMRGGGAARSDRRAAGSDG